MHLNVIMDYVRHVAIMRYRLGRLHYACKRSRLLQDNLPILLHDNAHCPVARNVTNILRRWHWEVLEHPPYSHDINPCDFDLLPQLKEPLRGTRFPDVTSVLRAVGRSGAIINKQHLAISIPDSKESLSKRLCKLCRRQG
ncbi:hypothetical protein AVEN_24963-1 [Araneus ventricosus]|uniref:Histone-lysine N-methyltransferase SETMAR n=1 Tax=Araneus ventricosus TaxID=182803 RepID=A0A4Y2G6A6_ARAVE|nr:hypothetical protein AVEN_24963-1 [Araneus ventricosus]